MAKDQGKREEKRDLMADLPEPPPPQDPQAGTNPAVSEGTKDAYTGKSDQDVTRNTGTGSGGATEYGGGNKNHPSRIAGKPPGT
jgi:hypothetical protein